MPKKSASARRGVQRNKPKAPKSFELVRPERVETEVEESGTTSAPVSTAVSTQEDSKNSGKAATVVRTKEEPKTSGKVAATVSTKEESKASGKVAATVSTKEESKTSGKAAATVSTKEESKTSDKATNTVSTKEESKTSGKAATAITAKEQENKTQERQNAPVPGSASARLAARRQAAQRLQQRSAATLITSEHFAYVRKDLIKIAVFAVLMFTAIIVLYFTLGRA